MLTRTFPLIFILSYAAFFIVIRVAGEGKSNVQRMAEESPLTAKAAAVRYWKKQTSNDLPKPWFVLNKASPLDAVQLAKFSKLAGDNNLSTQLPAFCSKANLLCFPDVSSSLAKHDKDVNFASEKTKNNWVEAGKFFREQNLKTGNIMPMPDIRDKMPNRSFLPRLILSKLPFSSSKISELHQIFKVDEDSTMAGKIEGTLNDCERTPSKGETRRCVASIEDMVDFTTSVLGRNIVVRTTENTIGSKGNILIGSVKGINGGKITQSISCHQSMFPYLIYYCHSVPKVRVYEADILDPKSKEKINHGVAICHIDTSSWSPAYGAFLELGSGPGKIEVCHWIFENDMIWITTD